MIYNFLNNIPSGFESKVFHQQDEVACFGFILAASLLSFFLISKVSSAIVINSLTLYPWIIT